jgi:hypothetical protein
MAAAISLNLITELIYTMYARIIAAAVRADRQDAKQPRPTEPPVIGAACGNNRVSTQQDKHMDIAAVFRGDRFRLVSGIACQTPEDARGFRQKSCSVCKKRRVHSHRQAIVATGGHNRVATQEVEQNGHCGDSPSRSWPGRFAGIIQNPGNSSKREWGKKKIRGLGSFRGRKPWQNACSRCLKPARDALNGGQ